MPSALNLSVKYAFEKECFNVLPNNPYHFILQLLY
jgi:hypothetical protein